MSNEKVTLGLSLKVENINIEEFVDGEKKADINSGTITNSKPAVEPDDTVAPVIIPNAGKRLLILGVLLLILVVGRISYLKFKDIKIK